MSDTRRNPVRRFLAAMRACPLLRLGLAAFVLQGIFVRLDSSPLWYLENHSESTPEAALRLAFFWGSLVWFGCLLLARSRWIAWPVVAVTGTVIALDQFYYHYINGAGFTPHEMFLALTNPSTVEDAIRLYWPLGWPVVAWSIVAVIGASVVLRRLAGFLPGRMALGSSVLAVPLIILMATEGYGPGGQVVMPLRIPVFYAHYSLTPAIPERDAPTLAPTREPLVDHIVVIMDESVMGSHLGINGYPRPTTPRLLGLRDRGEAKTLGVCSSAANFSVGSFLAMLSGTKAETLADDYDRVLTRPSMIAYAARAGYRALLLNSQDYLPWIAHERNTLGDGLDAKSVDRNRAPAWEWDDSMVEHAVDFVASNPRTLTIIAKRGLHTPYHDKCPPDLRHFAPFLESPAWSDDLIENINTYDNGVLWSVDGYLARLHEGLAKTGRSVLVIYTSDHGQILPGEKIEGYEFKRTHAMPDSPNSSVADVPLVLLAAHDAKALLPAIPATWRDASSHDVVFPSVLFLMGYDPEALRKDAGRGLWDTPAPGRRRVFFERSRLREFEMPDGASKLESIRAWEAERK